METATLSERVDAALDRVRPAIRRDGGDVWLIRIDGTVAFVQMVGACGGCSMVAETLKGSIEKSILTDCPEIRSVEAI